MFTRCSSPQERLTAWREIRKNTNHDIDQILSAFGLIKPMTRYIDYYTPKSWPSVFEIVSDGYFCQSGITLVLAATLYNLEFIKTPEISLQVVSNHITGNEGLVLCHDNMYYNFLPGKVVDAQFANDNSVIFDKHIIAIDKLFG